MTQKSPRATGQRPKKAAAARPDNGPVDPPQNDPDPDLQAAAEAEQRLLIDAAKDAQIQHLLNRCVQLNARVRKLERGANS